MRPVSDHFSRCFRIPSCLPILSLHLSLDCVKCRFEPLTTEDTRANQAVWFVHVSLSRPTRSLVSNGPITSDYPEISDIHPEFLESIKLTMKNRDLPVAVVSVVHTQESPELALATVQGFD